MTYGVKYRIAYRRLQSGNPTTIDILERDYVGAITDLTAYGDPWRVTFEGTPDNIYKPTLGSGATLKVKVDTPFQLLDLFTDDPQKFMIRQFDGISDEDSDASSDAGGHLVWQGFINAEIYNESYSNPLGDVVSINCNDGMVLLDKLKYKTASDEYYEGTVTVKEVLNNIFGKLGIEFTRVLTSNDLAVKPSPDLKVNPFLYLQIPNENFVDESGEPMSCRQVLDSIFGGITMVMYFQGGDIIITDPINLHDVTKGKSYTMGTFDDEASSTLLGGYLNLSNREITWGQTGSNVDVVPAVDEAIVIYNPYTFDKYEYDFNDVANHTVEGTFSDAGAYWYNENVEFKDWTNEYGEPAWGPYSVGIQDDNAGVATGSPTYAIHLYDHEAKYKYILPNFNSVTQDENLQLRLSFDVWVQTNSNDLNIYAGNANSHIINYIKIPICISVGNQHWRGGNTWGTSDDPSNYQPFLVIEVGMSTASPNYLNSVINDKWVKGTMTVPLRQSVGGDLISGNISIEIFDSLKSLFFANQIEMVDNTAFVYHVLLKNMLIEIIDASTGKVVVNESVKIKGFVSTNLTGKDNFTIETTCGTGTYGSSKGAFKTDQQTPAGINIVGLYRGTDTTAYNTSKLILQSFVSQYKTPRFSISGVLDVHEHLMDIRKKLIKDTNRGTRAYYILSGTYNDREETMEVLMIEVESTRDTIS